MMGDAATRPPFSFLWGDDGPSLEAAVYQALGAASVCWDDMRGTGTFRSEDCAEIAEALIAFTRAEAAKTLTTHDLCAELLSRAPVFGPPPATTDIEIVDDGGHP